MILVSFYSRSCTHKNIVLPHTCIVLYKCVTFKLLSHPYKVVQVIKNEMFQIRIRIRVGLLIRSRIRVGVRLRMNHDYDAGTSGLGYGSRLGLGMSVRGRVRVRDECEG